MGLEGEIRDLLQQGLTRSAALLAGFLLTGKANTSSENALLGEVFAAEGEHRRALSHYQLALTDSKSADQAGVRLRMADSHLQLKSDEKALALLDGVPLKQMNARYAMIAGRLSEQSGRTKQATAFYQHCLSLSPSAIEASMALVRLGSTAASVAGLAAKKELKFVPSFLSAYGNCCAHQEHAAIKELDELYSAFPKNPDLLVRKAQAQLQVMDPEQARQTLQAAHAADTLSLEGMDTLAYLLKKKGRAADLVKLVRHCLSVSDTRPESWVAAALYAEATGQKDKALSYVDKALLLDRRHPGGFLIKGSILQQLGAAGGAGGGPSQQHLEYAMRSFRRAHQLQPLDLTPFQGMIDSALMLKQFKQALAYANEAYQLMPKSPRVLVLVGQVSMAGESAVGQSQAERAFQKALALDAGCTDAVLGLLKLLTGKKKWKEAEAVLEKQIEQKECRDRDLLLTKLGLVCASQKQVDKAMTCYQRALAVTPDYKLAVRAIQQLEKGEAVSMDEAKDEDKEAEAEAEEKQDAAGAAGADDEAEAEAEAEADGDGEADMHQQYVPDDDDEFEQPPPEAMLPQPQH